MMQGVSTLCVPCYLSPLATKPQVLGFALYYLTECRNTAASLIFPFCQAYDQETSTEYPESGDIRWNCRHTKDWSFSKITGVNGAYWWLVRVIGEQLRRENHKST